MANKKITELDAATTLASTDVVPVVDVSEDVTKKITTTNLFRTLPDGTAAAPALAFSSDQANGVYLAGTDTVGISTGGTQRVTVDGSGNVTISGNLQVDGATTTVQSTTVTIDDKNLELGSVASPSNTTADGGGITLKGATDKTLKWIDSTGCWTFNQPMNFNDHVRIDSSGNVGIGVTSPVSPLHVRGASGAAPYFYLDAGSTAAIFGINDGATKQVYLGSVTNAPVLFRQNNTERLRIDSSGNVGVGTSSPVSRLTVGDNATNANAISISSPFATNNYGDLVFTTIGTTTYNARIRATVPGNGTRELSFITAKNASESTVMTLDGDGKVGIGTGSPAAKLAIHATTTTNSSSQLLRITSANGALFGIETDETVSNPTWKIGGIVSGGTAEPLAFYQVGSEVARIDSSGRLLIGTTSSLSQGTALQIVKDNGGALEVFRGADSATSNPFARFCKSRGTTASPTVVNSGDTAGQLSFCGYDGTNYIRAAAVEGQVDGTPGSNDMPGRLVFSTTADGASSPTERLRIDSSGNVGVGLTPTAKFHVGGTIQSQTGSTVAQMFTDGGAAYFTSVGAYPMLFQTNGSERLRIDSSGRVGIGISSPSRVLHIKASGANTAHIALIDNDSSNEIWQVGNQSDGDGFMALRTDEGTTSVLFDASGTNYINGGNVGIGTTSPASILELSSSSTPQLFISNTSDSINSGDAVATLDFRAGSSNTVVSRMASIADSTAEDGAHIVFENRTGGGSFSEKLRIDSSGNVGIGTSSPGRNLVINSGTSSGYIQLVNTNSGTAASNGFEIKLDSAGAIVDLINRENGAMRFFTNNTVRMRITSSGDFCFGSNVGANNDGSGISIYNASNPRLSFRNSTTGNTTSDGSQLYLVNSDLYVTNNENANLIFRTNSTERMRLDSGGRLLLNTTTEGHANADNLTVADSGNGGITIRTGTTHQGSLYFSDGTSGDAEYDGFINYKHDIRTFRIGTAATTRFSINSNGAWGLEGDSNYGTSGQVLTSNGNDSPTWQTPSSGAQIIEGNTNVECVDTGSNGHILFDTEGSERMRIASDGTVGIGCVPNSFQSGYDAVQIGGNLVLNVDSTGAGAGVYMGNNVYRDSGNSRWEYINTDEASQYYQANGEHVWRYAASGSANAAITWSEAMRIDSSGNVGIGGNGTGTGLGVYLQKTGSSAHFYEASDGTKKMIVGADSTIDYVKMGALSNHPVGFVVNNGEKMRIDSSGNVGIGTTTIEANSNYNTLEIAGDTSSGGAIVRLKTGDRSTAKTMLFCDTGGFEARVETNHPAIFSTNNTERMRLDSSGRLLIGTTTEGHTAADDLTIATTGNTGITLRSGTSNNGNLYFSDATSGTAEHAGFVQYNHANNQLRFGSGGTERLRITSAGDVQVKDFSPRIGAALTAVSGNFSSYFGASGTSNSNLPMIVERYNDNGVSIEFKRSNSVVGNINVTASSTNYATSSDHRLKENVVDLDGAITRVKQLAPKRFNFIVDADTTVDGFLAHEAATVVPEAVTGTYNEVDDENNPVYQGIDQSKLVPLLTAALQEAIAKIETLEAKVAALEAS